MEAELAPVARPEEGEPAPAVAVAVPPPTATEAAPETPVVDESEVVPDAHEGGGAASDSDAAPAKKAAATALGGSVATSMSRGAMQMSRLLARCKPVVLSWEDVAMEVADTAETSAALAAAGRVDNTIRPREGRKLILSNISGNVYPGEFVAIMGASGAGKTTLLNVLSRRNKANLGQIRVNGRPVDRSFRRMSAFVQQEDLFLGTLTVREHLRYIAMLRMDQSLSQAEVDERVDHLIDALDLTKVAHSMIGGVGMGLPRGISGGERKRLAFASEIITDPSLLFADEPTSGLDSYMAQNVVSMMQMLARNGRTILATIHQPSSEVYAMFDKLMLLAEGRLVYYGTREGAVEYFRTLGPDYVCPDHYNPADFWIQKLADAKNIPGEIDRLAQHWAASELRANNLARLAYAVDSGASDVETPMPRTSESGRDSPGFLSPAAGVAAAPDASGTATYAASWWKQLRVLTDRGFTATMRNPVLSKVRLFQSIVLAVIAGLIFLRLGDDQTSVQDKNGAVFFILINQSFSAVFGIIQTFPVERPIFLREHEAGTYRVDTYYIAKTLSDIPFQVFFPSLFTVIAYWMIGFNDDAWRFGAFLGILLLACNAAMSLGYFISCVTPSVEVALGIGPVLLIPFLLFGGFFVNTESIPKYFIWLEYLSWFKYGFSALGVVIWTDVDIQCPSTGTCPFPSGEDVMNFYSLKTEHMGRDIGALLALLFGWRILAFIALWIGARNTRQNE